MLDLILTFLVTLLVTFILLKCKTPMWATVILVFALGASLAYIEPQIIGLNQTVYADLLGLGPLNLLFHQGNSDILTAIQLSNFYGPFLIYIVIGLNLIATLIGFLVAYSVARVSGKGSRKH